MKHPVNIARRSLLVGGASFCAFPSLASGLVEPTAMQPRPQAPPLVLPDLAGASHDVRRRQMDLNNPPIILAFWATWCAPCRRELPSLVRLREEVAQSELIIYAVNYGESQEKIPPFLKDVELAGGVMEEMVLLDPSKSTMAPWRVGFLPLSYLIAPSGKIAFQIAGEVDWQDPGIAKVLSDLVAEPAKS